MPPNNNDVVDSSEDLAPEDYPLANSVRRLSVQVESLGKAMFSREDAKRARRRAAFGVLIVVLIAQVISLATFVTVASTCFINAPQRGFGRTVCNIIPGYDRTEKEGQKNLQQFHGLLATIPQNSRDNIRQQQEINRLRREVARLEHH